MDQKARRDALRSFILTMRQFEAFQQTGNARLRRLRIRRAQDALSPKGEAFQKTFAALAHGRVFSAILLGKAYKIVNNRQILHILVDMETKL